MNDYRTFKRQVYMDASFSEEGLSDIYLYTIDYKTDKSFRTDEIKYVVPTEVTPKEGAEEEATDIRLEFLDKIAALVKSDVPTQYYALDAESLMAELIEPMKVDIPKAKRVFNDLADKCLDSEWLHDFLAMSRVIPMTEYDEKPEMSAELRRRMKEKFHEHNADIKKVRSQHIYVSYTKEDSSPVLYLKVFDKNDTTLGEYKLHGKITDDVMVAKVADIIKSFPDADVLADRTSIRIYRFFRKAVRMEHLENGLVYSVASMLHAVGKDDVRPDAAAWKDYLEAASDLRFDRISDDNVYGFHVLRIPVEVSGKRAWTKNFKKNTMWKPASPYEYYLMGGEDKVINDPKKGEPKEIMGKLVIKKDRECYILKLTRVSIRQWAGDFAVITLVAENRFYPGERDKARINQLASSLWIRSNMKEDLPEAITVQVKNPYEKTYSLSAMTRQEAGEEPWIGLLLTIGRKSRNQGGDRFAVTSLSEKMYVYDVEEQESVAVEEAVNAALIRHEYVLSLEKRLADCLEPLDGCTFSDITKGQRREIRSISREYACIAAALTYKQERGEAKASFRNAQTIIGTKSVEERLEKKLELLYE